MSQRPITVPCPRCSGTGMDTHEDRHAGTIRDICRDCGGEGTVLARTGETPAAAYQLPPSLPAPGASEEGIAARKIAHQLGLAWADLPTIGFGKGYTQDDMLRAARAVLARAEAYDA